MSRARWKGPVFDKNFLLESFYQSEFIDNNEDDAYEISSRNFTVSNLFLNKIVVIHTGNSFKRIFIEREKLGFKFGGFAFTRKYTRKEIVTKSLK